MAASEKLTSWLLDNSSRLNLQATAYDWPRLWRAPGLYDMQVSIAVNGRNFIGRGTARDEDTAFLKAGAEAVERAFCAGHHIDSTGVAVHTDEASARKNALNEITERDAFFCHFLTNTPFTLVSHTFKSDLSREFKGIFEETAARGVWFDFYRAQSSSWPVIICVATGLRATPQFGGVVGLGAHSNEWRSVHNAFFECLRNVSALCLTGDPVRSISRCEFDLILKPTPTDHQRLALDVGYWSGVSHLFPKESTGPLVPQPTNHVFNQSWRVEPLSCPYPELEDAPVFAFRTVFDDRLGRPIYQRQERSPTTLARLSEFLGRAISHSELNPQPHFLG